ncbi:MAG: Mor transcription activator family protein [Peptostreptococcaceae bacterium]|nr:Mor transcription activator family protein [Peptostreptococcaceae bacterium]
MKELLSLQDIPTADARRLAEIVGIENYIKIVEQFGGLALYIPKRDTLLRKIRNHEIRSKFNGTNYKELALEYNLTEVSIRTILAELAETHLPGQIRFEEYEEKDT